MLESFESQKARQINGDSPTAKVSPTKRKQSNPKPKQPQMEGKEAAEKIRGKEANLKVPCKRKERKERKKRSCVLRIRRNVRRENNEGGRQIGRVRYNRDLIWRSVGRST